MAEVTYFSGNFLHWMNELRKVKKLNQKVPWQLGRRRTYGAKKQRGVSTEKEGVKAGGGVGYAAEGGNGRG